MFIDVLNFREHNPRKDVKNPSWVRLQIDFWDSHEFFPLGAAGKMVWIAIISMAQKKQSERIYVEPKLIANNLDIDISIFEFAIDFLQKHECLRVIDDSHVTDTSRGRTATRRNVTEETMMPPSESSGRAPAPTRVDKFSGWDLGTSKLMLVAIKRHKPGFIFRARIEQWADQFRLARERDGLGEEQIEQALDWLYNAHDRDAEFWRGNILCPKNLREKWNRISDKIQQYQQLKDFDGGLS
jgi:hypothetical protein